MAWSIFKESEKLNLTKSKSSARYELLIAGNTNMGSVQNISETKIVYDITCEPYLDNHYKIALYIIQHEFIKGLNSAFTEMFEVTRKMMQILRHVEVIINHKFEIIKILNLEDIFNQWQLLKGEKLFFQDISIRFEEVISLKDEDIKDEKVLKSMISQMEFFDILQTIGYGYSFPYFFDKTKPNMLRNGYIDYSGTMRINNEKSTNSEYYIEGKGEGDVTSRKLKEWYGGFPFFSEIGKKGIFTYKCEASVDKNNMLPEKCTLRHQEYIQEDLQWSLMYLLKRIKNG